MTETTTQCPHCGFESEDDEMCQACGALFEDNIPVRDISFAQVVGSIFSWLQDKGLHRINEDEDEDDVNLDPIYSSIPGNAGYDLYGDED